MGNTLSAEMFCESDHRIDAPGNRCDAPGNRNAVMNAGQVNADVSDHCRSAGQTVRRWHSSAREDRKADRKSGELGDMLGIRSGEDHGYKLS